MYRNWSTDGVTTERLSSSQVLCTSNHLTSFAVLVDHTGTTGVRFLLSKGFITFFTCRIVLEVLNHLL